MPSQGQISICQRLCSDFLESSKQASFQDIPLLKKESGSVFEKLFTKSAQFQILSHPSLKPLPPTL